MDKILSGTSELVDQLMDTAIKHKEKTDTIAGYIDSCDKKLYDFDKRISIVENNDRQQSEKLGKIEENLDRQRTELSSLLSSLNSLKVEVRLYICFVIAVCVVISFVSKDFYTKLDNLTTKVTEVTTKVKVKGGE